MLWGLMLAALYCPISAALLAVGDSRTIFVSGVVANVLNVALDYVLIKQEKLSAAICTLEAAGWTFEK